MSVPPRHAGIDLGLLSAWVGLCWVVGGQGRRFVVLRRQPVNMVLLAVGCVATAALIVACEGFLP